MIVFVYGSLKKGKRLHNYLKNTEFLGNALTCDKYPMIVSKSGWYPYLLDKKGEGKKVKGEVYKISPKLLKTLDRLEEVPHYYKRKKICVKLDFKTVNAWCYFYAKNKKFLKKECLSEF